MRIIPQVWLIPIGVRALGWGAMALLTLGGGGWAPGAIATPNPQTKAEGFNALEDVDYWAGLCRLQINAGAYDKALVACEQAIALAPADANLWTLRSNVLLQLQNYPDAIASADRALFFDQQSSLAITYRCIGYAALNDNEAALDACNNALRVDGNWGSTSPALAWLHRGIILSQAGQLEQATVALERTLLLEPNYSLALAYQCRIRNDLGLAQTAIPSCEAALAGDGQWGNESAAMAWAEQGRAYSQLRDYGAAIAAYDQAINLDPNNATTWTAQGQVLQQLQRPIEALTSFTRATELEAPYSQAQLGRCGTLNRLNQHEAALEACNLALQGDGRWGDRGIVEVFNQRSIALTGLSRYDEALASINRAVGITPDYAEAHHHRAVILWYLERYDDALAANQRSLELAPNHARTWLNRGIILRSMQRHDDALEAYDQGLQIAPYDDALWANRSVVLWHLQRYDEALASADQAIAFNPDSAQGWYNRAIALTAQKQWQNALDAYAQGLVLMPPNSPQRANALTGQGVALINLGRYQAAIAILQAAIALNPNQPLAQQSLQTAQQNLQPPPP
ncbi:tetratricopeptide repeat protein [Nodosilinea sp. E11]|uniref:tetratricopeptide repeat protein n=1 Tax=Nodosilinea sp. E11 TaxID=3037479 RepID=UPI0029343B7D|nr:tetratricopeptide repeat protein [Nodosilinea sp. E11]WOD37097.1 tetratricopeptide repeat protein [Nodosilinea sp. E11]